MEKVSGFYKKILYYGRNENWSYTFLKYIMAGFYVLIMMLTASKEFLTEMWSMLGPIVMFMGFSLYGCLAPFVLSKEKNGFHTLNEKLKYVPISKKAFFKKRWQVLWQFVAKLTAISFGLNLIISISFLGGVSICNLLPLSMGLLGLFIGLRMIKI